MLHSVRLAIAITVLCSCAVARWQQTDSPRKRIDVLALSVAPNPSADDRCGGHGIRQPQGSFVQSQSPRSRLFVIDTAIVLSTQLTTRHLYSFVTGGARTSDLKQKMVGGAWVNDTRTSMSLDAEGRVISGLSEIWLNDQWTNRERESYLYDAGGRQTMFLLEQWSFGAWATLKRQITSYDASGKWISDLLEQWSGGQVVTKEVATCSYDAAGNATMAAWTCWTNGQQVSSLSCTYTYDAHSALLSLEQLQKSSSGEEGMRFSYTYDASYNYLSRLEEHRGFGQWANYCLDTYSYDAGGNIHSQVSLRWNGNGWSENNRCTFTHDAHGRKLSETREELTSGQWTFLSRYTYTYDAMDNRLTELTEGWTFGRKTSYMIWTSTYDDSGRKLSVSCSGISNGTAVHALDSTYAYDLNGKMLLQLYEERSNSQLVTSDRYIYTYDMGGRQTSVLHESWVNSAWVPTDIMDFNTIAILRFNDDAGNRYEYSGYSVILKYKTLTTSVEPGEGATPVQFSLSQNYPNPFNPTTVVAFQLPVSSQVRIAVYDMLGREVALLMDERKDPGEYTLQFDGSRLTSGVYYYRLRAGDYMQTRKMLLLK